VLSLTADDAERSGLLSFIKGLRFIRIEAFDTDAAVTATELLRFGHSWAAVHAIHAARPSPAHPRGRFLLTLTPKAYAGTCVQAVHPRPVTTGAPNAPSSPPAPTRTWFPGARKSGASFGLNGATRAGRAQASGAPVAICLF
jgi:hypothetical protein